MILSFPPDRHSTSQESETVTNKTSGMLYSFDVQPKNNLQTSKSYIPVKHDDKNDRIIAQGLVTYLQRRGHIQLAGGFMKALGRLLI